MSRLRRVPLAPGKPLRGQLRRCIRELSSFDPSLSVVDGIALMMAWCSRTEAVGFGRSREVSIRASVRPNVWPAPLQAVLRDDLPVCVNVYGLTPGRAIRSV